MRTRLRFSENARDWRNLTMSSVAALTLLFVLGAWRGHWPWAIAAGAGAVAFTMAGLAWARPMWFRRWYRGVRWTGHQVGRVTGVVLLTVVFVLVMWPLGWCLRWAGRRPLHDRIDPRLASYWSPARQPGRMERMF
jgi:hypothetical protein